MATHGKAGNLARGFHDQLSNVVIAALFFLKGDKPERRVLGYPLRWDICTCLERPKGGFSVCFPRRCALLAVDSSWPLHPSHGFVASVVFSPTELGNQRVLDQLVAESTPQSSMMNMSLCLGLENNDWC